jgi:hypothetical protein
MSCQENLLQDTPLALSGSGASALERYVSSAREYTCPMCMRSGGCALRMANEAAL